MFYIYISSPVGKEAVACLAEIFDVILPSLVCTVGNSHETGCMDDKHLLYTYNKISGAVERRLLPNGMCVKYLIRTKADHNVKM